MRGFLSKEYLPSIRINSEVLAPVMMLLSNLPSIGNIQSLKYFWQTSYPPDHSYSALSQGQLLTQKLLRQERPKTQYMLCLLCIFLQINVHCDSELTR